VGLPGVKNVLSSPWPIAEGQPRLAPGVVHVWYLPLDLAAEQVEALYASLSDDERERAARYHFERHRRRFITCRGQVRGILARYVNGEPANLRFRYGPRGKPALGAGASDAALEFNVSNSEEVALLAVALDRELGVDVEHVREPRDFEALARQFFARSEVEQLRSLPEDQRREAFFHCWTRKEAVLKAVGTGLAFPLDKVVVTLAPGDPARLVAYDDDPAGATQWWLAGLAPRSGYVGALAARGSPLEVQCWRSSYDDSRQPDARARDPK
jgi:4'-phosphopantetheinyl transferase